MEVKYLLDIAPGEEAISIHASHPKKKLIIPTKSKQSTVNVHTIHWIQKFVLQCKMEVKYLLNIAPSEEAVFHTTCKPYIVK